MRDCIVSIAIVALLARAFCRSGQALLQERYWRVMCKVLLLALVHSLGSGSRISAIVHHLLLEVQELALEAWIRVDHASFRFNIAHGLEQGPVLLMHQVGDDTGCRTRLSSVTVTSGSEGYYTFILDTSFS